MRVVAGVVMEGSISRVRTPTKRTVERGYIAEMAAAVLSLGILKPARLC
jgi:hypothetical protein